MSLQIQTVIGNLIDGVVIQTQQLAPATQQLTDNEILVTPTSSLIMMIVHSSWQGIRKVISVLDFSLLECYRCVQHSVRGCIAQFIIKSSHL